MSDIVFYTLLGEATELKDAIIVKENRNVMVRISIHVKAIVPVLVTFDGFIIDGKSFTDKTIDVIDCGLGVVLNIDDGHWIGTDFGLTGIL